MTAKPRIGIILSTTRPGRFADRPTRWLFDIASARLDAEFEIVDLRDYPLPFFEEEMPPALTPPTNPAAQRWAATMGRLDGYIFVTAEYNRGLPAVLKNALDYASGVYSRKPATFIGYGVVGAARSIEQLRLILNELQVATLRNAVHINRADYIGMVMQGKDFADYPQLEQGVGPMLDELVWWASALKTGREQVAA